MKKNQTKQKNQTQQKPAENLLLLTAVQPPNMKPKN